MKSKSKNIRQMLQDIQAKRKKLDWKEAELKERLAKIEGVTPREASKGTVIGNPTGVARAQELADETRRITTTHYFGTPTQGVNPVDVPVYDVTDDVAEVFAAGNTSFADLKRVLQLLGKMPEYKNGTVYINIRRAGFSENDWAIAQRKLNLWGFTNFLLVEEDYQKGD